MVLGIVCLGFAIFFSRGSLGKRITWRRTVQNSERDGPVFISNSLERNDLFYNVPLQISLLEMVVVD